MDAMMVLRPGPHSSLASGLASEQDVSFNRGSPGLQAWVDQSCQSRRSSPPEFQG